MIIEKNLVDWQTKTIFPAKITVENQYIKAIERIDKHIDGFVMPGFVDAHVHIESSLLIPSEFARMAVVHGTVATVSDPHEIANVCGKEGVLYMIENASKVPFNFCFGAPSCVPATIFETNGASLDAEVVNELLNHPHIYYLTEMMNYPGVIYNDEEVHRKIAYAKASNLPIDGHAPSLSGESLDKYISAGISTDHECSELDEAIEKAKKGMKILIREGSAAKNFDSLIPIIDKFPAQVMFCSDDKHPDSLEMSHIRDLAQKALDLGYDFWDIIYAACIHPVLHYQIPSGLLRVGDKADFITTDNLQSFSNICTYINGIKVAEHGQTFIKRIEEKSINNFNTSPKNTADFILNIPVESRNAQVIVIHDGQLLTSKENIILPTGVSTFESDINQDIIKLVVVNRYSNAKVAMALVKNSGIKSGAIASSVAHDSHNIVAMGCNDKDICNAVNLVIKEKGGLAYSNNQIKHILPLPVAGLMNNMDAWEMADAYTAIDELVKTGTQTTLKAPFMTLSFLALPVIPQLKLTDKGLFDVNTFAYSELFS